MLWEFEGLSHIDSRLYLTGRGDTGGHAIGSGQFVVGRW